MPESGSHADDGANGTGGVNSIGGVNSLGGAKPIGGAATAGGTLATGGMPATGGLPTTGGAKPTGGAPATGGTPSTGGSSATCSSGGYDTMTCNQLTAAYACELANAKVCDNSGSANQCDALVLNKLDCPCNTSANSLQKVALANMDAIRVAWNAKLCSPGVCTNLLCVSVQSGTCSGSSSTSKNTCADSTELPSG